MNECMNQWKQQQQNNRNSSASDLLLQVCLSICYWPFKIECFFVYLRIDIKRKVICVWTLFWDGGKCDITNNIINSKLWRKLLQKIRNCAKTIVVGYISPTTSCRCNRFCPNFCKERDVILDIALHVREEVTASRFCKRNFINCW